VRREPLYTGDELIMRGVGQRIACRIEYGEGLLAVEPLGGEWISTSQSEA
jgi:hypothetical protein